MAWIDAKMKILTCCWLALFYLASSRHAFRIERQAGTTVMAVTEEVEPTDPVEIDGPINLPPSTTIPTPTTTSSALPNVVTTAGPQTYAVVVGSAPVVIPLGGQWMRANEQVVAQTTVSPLAVDAAALRSFDPSVAIVRWPQLNSGPIVPNSGAVTTSRGNTGNRLAINAANPSPGHMVPNAGAVTIPRSNIGNIVAIDAASPSQAIVSTSPPPVSVPTEAADIEPTEGTGVVPAGISSGTTRTVINGNVVPMAASNVNNFAGIPPAQANFPTTPPLPLIPTEPIDFEPTEPVEIEPTEVLPPTGPPALWFLPGVTLPPAVTHFQGGGPLSVGHVIGTAG